MKLSFISGKDINFREVNEADAAFILALRLDDRLGRFMSQTDNDLEKQIEWIRNYKKRAQEFYFIIESKDNVPYGTIRIYDVKDDSFSWGSWIIKQGSPSYVAIQSVLLIYETGFFKLGYSKCHFEVMKENSKIVDFHKRFGAEVVSEDQLKFYFNLSLDDYKQLKSRYAKFMPEPVKGAVEYE